MCGVHRGRAYPHICTAPSPAQDGAADERLCAEGWVGSRPSSADPVSTRGHPGRKGLAGSHQGRGASPGMRAEKGAITKLGPQGLGVHSIKSNFHSLVSAMSQIYRHRSPLPTLHHKHHPDAGEKAAVDCSHKQQGPKLLEPGMTAG